MEITQPEEKRRLTPSGDFADSCGPGIDFAGHGPLDDAQSGSAAGAGAGTVGSVSCRRVEPQPGTAGLPGRQTGGHH